MVRSAFCVWTIALRPWIVYSAQALNQKRSPTPKAPYRSCLSRLRLEKITNESSFPCCSPNRFVTIAFGQNFCIPAQTNPAKK
ncbi:hypothetical protein B0J17DRAFT_657896 [Rhizoctonia solani]|nr:hypothetical protein B0J17DRAFT_657896 [Rhizoctonia solani]